MATATKFTAKWLDNLKPTPGKQVEYSDAGASGLRLRVSPGGAKTFYWYVKQGGKLRKINLGRYGAISLHDARAKLSKLKQEHEDGNRIYLDNAAQSVAQLAELFYEKRIVPHRKRPDVVRQILDHDVIPTIGKLKLRSITTPQVARVVDLAVERGARDHAGKILAVLKQLFRYGVSRGYLQINPAEPLDRKGLGVVAGKRDRYLNTDEISEMWHGLDQAHKLTNSIRLGLKVLLLTGTRSRELRLSRWDDFDFDKAEWFVPEENSKNGKAWTVTLSPLAVEQLQELYAQADGNPWVMPGVKPDSPLTDKAIARAVKRLFQQGILTGDEWTPHDLRRTLRTHLADMGVEPYIAEKCLNHSLGRLDEIYNKSAYTEQRREALTRWGDKVARVVGIDASNVVEMVG